MPSDLKGSVCPDGMNWRDEVQGMNSKMGQCGVCARWTKEGYHLPSGNRNPRTGETPCDNFICSRCQRDAERNWFVKRQAGLIKVQSNAVAEGARKVA